MTKEEIAIKALENMKIDASCGYTDATEIFDTAIKALSKRTIDADELLRRIAEKAKTPSLSEDTINGLCGATAIIYDMLNESEQEQLRARLRESGQECD